MDIQVTHSHEVMVVALTGNLDTASAPQLKQTLEDLLARGKTRLVLDLFGVAYVLRIFEMTRLRGRRFLEVARRLRWISPQALRSQP